MTCTIKEGQYHYDIDTLKNTGEYSKKIVFSWDSDTPENITKVFRWGTVDDRYDYYDRIPEGEFTCYEGIVILNTIHKLQRVSHFYPENGDMESAIEHAKNIHNTELKDILERKIKAKNDLIAKRRDEIDSAEMWLNCLNRDLNILTKGGDVYQIDLLEDNYAEIEY